MTEKADLQPILDRAAAGGRITPEEALVLYRDAPLHALGAAAGGAVISGGLGYAFVPVMGAIIAGLALLLVWFSGRAQPEEAFASQ